jgi:hypothetical protein
MDVRTEAMRIARVEYDALSPEEQQRRTDADLKKKQAGTCPFCTKLVSALVVEHNTVRRDKCTCPECKQPIYVCRTPGCHDYAKGTETYDHEFCPDCTGKMAALGAEVGKTALKVGGLIAVAAAEAAIRGKKK